MQKVLAILVTSIAVASCSSRSTRRQDEETYLANVALCFQDAVSLLQREPESVDDFGTFMREASHKLQAASDTDTVADWAKLRWGSTGFLLLTPGGGRVRCRITNEEHDDYSDGSSWFSTYEFYVPGQSGAASTTIEFSTR